ncbi:MAG: ParD-like family protein [Magnetococcales bacterium]|nr:ParD-like family protein [Magnetococcales bacterium]
MEVSIQIDNYVYEEAKNNSCSGCRTVAEQIGFWAKIGKAALDNPDLPINFIHDLLLAQEEGAEYATPFVAEGTHD